MKVVFDGNIWNQYSIVWLSEMTEQSVQATLWRNFFGHLEQQKKLLYNLAKHEDLDEEYQMIESVAKAKQDFGRKRKLPANQDNDKETKKKKKTKDGMKNGENPEDILNGDDVPLVEEVVEGLLDEENGEEASKGLSVNGDNFMNTVMKMNQAQNAEENDDEPMFATSLRSSFGLKEKAKKGSKRKMKIDNGLGVVAVDEELVMKKSNKKVKAEGSVEEGKKCLAWLIHPENVDTFFDETWEKRPLHIKRRSQSQYYKHTFSTKAFDDILKQQNVQFTKNLDVTSYSEGKRETHNPEGRAYAPVVWDFYNNGCSLRMLNPQTFDDQVWKLCASLQEFFGSFVGTNLYLTPPGTQGFAPHYDDVEVFIMQLEGKKHWRLYQPRCAQETLPRFSSPNFSQDEIGKPIMDVTLEPGDLLYMPRGTIHQGNCLEDAHSLHLTVSCYQLNSMGDLLEKLLPSALKIAMEEDVEFRQGLPTNYLHYMGVAHSDRSDSQARRDFQAQIKRLMTKLCNFAPLDGAADQMGKRLMNISLPPYLTGQESARCVQAGGERWNVAKQRVVNRVEIDPETEIRLIRAHCLRLVVEEDTSIRIYYNVENTREYEEVGPQFLELDADTAPGIEALIQHYPNYVKVVDLPIEELDLKMKVVQDLWEKKLLLTKFPLEAHYDD